MFALLNENLSEKIFLFYKVKEYNGRRIQFEKKKEIKNYKKGLEKHEEK